MKGLSVFKFHLFILLYSLIMLLGHQYTVNRQTLTGFCLCLQGTYSLLMSQACEQSQAGIKEEDAQRAASLWASSVHKGEQQSTGGGPQCPQG